MTPLSIYTINNICLAKIITTQISCTELFHTSVCNCNQVETNDVLNGNTSTIFNIIVTILQYENLDNNLIYPQ